MTIQERERQILKNAEDGQKRVLWEDRNYGSAAAFWSSAVRYGLATREEASQAEKYYGEMWHYRGD